jgi:hypothetical protein
MPKTTQAEVKHKFSDQEVITVLKKHFPENHQLMEINQTERRMLFKNTDGLYQVWAYTCHLEDKLDSFYVTGCTHHIMRDIKEIFNNPSYLKDSDKAMYEN